MTNLLQSTEGFDIGKKLEELRNIPPGFTQLWQIVQVEMGLQDGWESGEDVFSPKRKITSFIRNPRNLHRCLRKISIADAREELARYEITRLDPAQEANYYDWQNYQDMNDDSRLSDVHSRFLACRIYYNPNTILTESERKQIFHNLSLANYLILLCEKFWSIENSRILLEEARKRALHLLDDSEIKKMIYHGKFPEERGEGRAYSVNHRDDIKELRYGWRQLVELGNARRLQIDIQNAIHALDIVHDRAFDAFPGVSNNNPEYIRIQEQTRLLLDELKDTVADLDLPVGYIEDRLGK